MHQDRRVCERNRAVMAVEIDAGARKGRVGVTRDTSPSGMLMATPSRFEIGEQLALTLFLSGGRREHVRGRVMRIETAGRASNEPWRYRLGIAFEEPVGALSPDGVSALS